MLPIFILAINNAEDRSFVEIIYYQYKDKIYKTVYDILNDTEDAEDITAETFIKIIDKLQDYRDKNDNELAGIIITIAKNLAIDKYRRKNKIEFFPITETDIKDEANSDDIIDFIIRKELHEKLYQAVDRLDEDYGRVVKLKLGYNYTNKQIGEILNISDGNVRVRYHRAKKIIAEYLKGDGEDG